MRIKYVLNMELHDDNTDFGGVSFLGETVEDFIAETGFTKWDSVEELNKVLIQCGIKPIEI